MIKGFRDFIVRGNVVDLGVGIVIGAAFTTLVTQMTQSFLEPLIRLVAGGGEFAGTFEVNEVVFDYGAFVNAAITFFIAAAALYFLVVGPMNKLNERRARGQETEPELTNEEKMVLLLEDIATSNKR